MSRRTATLVLIGLSCILAVPTFGQTGLSQNSDINSADTWVVVDLTVTTNGTINLPNSFYNPATGTTSSVLNLAPPTQTFHVEAGYDSNGGLVMNLWPTGTAVNPNTTDAEAIGFIRFAGGQATVFAQSGAPISLVPPAGISTGWPLGLLGSNPAASVIGNLVVPNIQNYATAIKASLTMSTSPTAAYVIPPVKTGSSASWAYVPSGSVWVAQQVVLSPAMSDGSASRTIQFANMSWYDNATNDAARAAKGFTNQPFPSPTTSSPSGLTTQTPSSGANYVNNLGGLQNVAFVHGFASSSSTWNRMVGWLNQDFLFGTEAVPSLTWYNTLSSQGTALIDDINSAGGANYILIGHSQGGVISRYAAQQYQNQNPPLNPPAVKGVVTLDSPHQGLPLAIVGSDAIAGGFQAIANSLWDTTGCITPYDNFVCYMAALAYEGGPVVAADWVSSNSSVGDLTPGSPFLTRLNGTTENFIQAGIVSNTPMRWNEMRLLDNAFFGWAGCNYPDAGCGERAIATYTGYTYDVVEADFLFCIFMELIDSDDAADWAAYADYFLNIMIGMDVMDAFWNAIVSGFSASDAIVPASSQNYPYSSAVQYPIYGADSHTGATRSTYVHPVLDSILGGPQFRVQTQASCSFSTSPTNYSISGNGGSSTFGLTTGAGCQWSAVSQAPWISITSGASGTSSGNIAFSVAANPSTIPRTGTIQVGSESSTLMFTVYQGGLCTYALSANTVSIPSGGGSASVTVYAPNDNGCVWSAVPNAGWITITAGASGTGTGSFTVSASANPGDTDLLGTVTIMSQTLAVILGNPIGTPGTGSVTINGTPKSVYVCKPGCATGCAKSCATLTYEYGTVYLSVGGDTYFASYSGTETAAQLAASLANGINSGSLISASVSSSKITLTSKVNGSLTNYSLSTSYTYDTTHFSSPAFTPSASGSSLSGGTD